MKNYFFFLLILALTSCSSFERMKYGQLNKVPATPQEFTSSRNVLSPAQTDELTGSKKSDSLAQEVLLNTDTFAVETQMELPVELGSEKCVLPVSKLLPPAVKRQIKWNGPMRRDWSLLIGLFFLAGGLIALSMCIFFYPFAGLNFLWTILFELFTLYVAWRLLGSGIVYFITRFRSKKNFSER